jgi:hypothetical protein
MPIFARPRRRMAGLTMLSTSNLQLKNHLRRLAPFFFYLAAVIALISSVAYFGWVRTWSSVNIRTMYPAFADMRVIQGAVISAEKGLDPRVSNPGDPWERPFNYPMLWFSIGKALNFTNETQFIFICTAMVFCFIGICAFLIFRFPSFGLLASLVSTATLLGVERGNTDLLIFCLLFPAALWLSTLPIPILLATVLKLYPIFALVGLFIERKFRLFVISLAAALTVFIYLWDQLKAIRSTTPTVCTQYGFASLEACFAQYKLPFWQLAGTLAAIGIVTLALAYYFSKSSAARPLPGTAFNLFITGAAIYVGTFIFSSNFDYRLIFLIFCIPFLQTRPFAFAGLLVVVIVLAMNQILMIKWLGMNGFVLSILARIATFAVLGAYLLAAAATVTRHAKPVVT